MSNARRNIQEILAKKDWDGATVKALMLNCRELLEAKGQQQKYGRLNLYATWCAHPQLTRSMTAFQILLDLTINICEHNRKPKAVAKGDIHKVIIETVGLARLKAEMLSFLGEHNLQTRFLQRSPNWKSFLEFLIWDLVEKPITFPSPITDKRDKNLFDRIHKEASDRGFPDWGVTSLFFVEEAGKAWVELKLRCVEQKKGRLLVLVVVPTGVVT